MRTIYFEKNIPRVLLAKALRPILAKCGFLVSFSPTRFVDLQRPHCPALVGFGCATC